VVIFSLLGEFSFLFVEDVELDFFVFNVLLELSNLLAEGGDFLGGFRDFVGSEIDSSVVLIDFGFTVNFVLSVFLVSFLLLEDEVFS
jgi:hypothetical protein